MCNFLSTVLLFIDFSIFLLFSLSSSTNTYLSPPLYGIYVSLAASFLSPTLRHTFEVFHSIRALFLSLSHPSPMLLFLSHLHDTHILFTFHILFFDLAVHAFCLCLCMLGDTPCFYVCTVLCVLYPYRCYEIYPGRLFIMIAIVVKLMVCT